MHGEVYLWGKVVEHAIVPVETSLVMLSMAALPPEALPNLSKMSSMEGKTVGLGDGDTCGRGFAGLLSVDPSRPYDQICP